MKRIITSLLLFVLLLTAVCGCSTVGKSELKLYVIKRSQLSTAMTASEKYKAVVTEGRLAFDGDDIEGYNWQTHTAYLKKDSVPSVGIVTEESGGSALFKTDDTYAFALVLGNELIYIGGFKNGVKNPSVPLQPCITDNGTCSFRLTFDKKYADTEDLRSDSRLYAFFQKNGMLSSKTE